MTARIYEHGRVLTGDPARPYAAGLRVEGGRITHLLEGAAPAGLAGERVDLGGAAILPGLVDAHLHLAALGAASDQLDLRGAESAEAIAARVQEAAARTPAGGWIRGFGWDQNRWPGAALPDRRALDAAAPGHPVWLVRIDGHAVWMNGPALARTGMEAPRPDPPGGAILRFPAGQPTGVLLDNAMDLAQAALPAPTRRELRAQLEAGLSRVRAAGLTGVHDMGTTPEMVELLCELAAEGRLTARYTAYLHGTDEALAALLARGPWREGRLRVVGVKLYADGALGSRGAALLAPYHDAPEGAGLLVQEPAVLARRVRAARAAGFQVAIHAIGDLGNRVALDALGPSRRDRVEHAQIVAPEDHARFAALNVIASVQPTHATSDHAWVAARLGRARLGRAYPLGSLLRTGARLALGSDAPIESENPWYGIHAAVTRQDAWGQPPDGFFPGERLTLREAIHGFTRGPAFAAGDEDLGVLRPGALADLTVVDQDPEAIPPEGLRALRILRTIVEGQEVYRAP